MKKVAKLTSALAFAALCAAFSTGSVAKAETMKEKDPAPKAGEQILMTAELPLATGGTWTGGDAMPLGGPNPIDETKTETLKFWFFLPSNESAKTDGGFPMLLFLHGAGERGDNPEKVKIHGPAMLCSKPEKAKDWPFLTVSPQCPGVRFWSPAQLRVLIDQICDNYPVDRSRIYVTGLSMGGFGTWGLIAHSSDIIAAAAPLCGGYDVSFAPKMAKTPIWTFHGDADGAVKYEYTKNLVEAVKKAGNKDIQFTTYPGVNHNCWTQTYDNPELYRWFLSKKLEK